jgi:branched-chain amino acid transport system permease protein
MSAFPARVVVPVVVVLLLAVVPLVDVPTGGVLPGTLASPGTLQILALCLVFGALALSFDVLFGHTGLLSFGHALYFAGGVYGTALAMEHLALALLPAAVVAVVGTGVLAALVGAVSLRVGQIAFAMVTLAFAQAGSILVSLNPWDLTGGELGLGLPFEHVPAAFLGVLNTANLYWLALALLVITYAAVAWMTRSVPGRIWEAIRENEQRVRVLGLRPYPFKLMSFVAAAVLGSLAGVVYLLLVGGAHPSITSAQFTLTLLVMVVLGGSGTRWGPVVGGVLYTYLDQRLSALATSDTVSSLPAALRVPLSEPLFVLGVLFILIILFVPGGVAGLAGRLRVGRLRRGRRGGPTGRVRRA